MDDYNRIYGITGPEQSGSSIYPQLPTNGDPNNFRLQKSCEVLQNLEKEIKHYEEVRKKYNRARGIFTKISVCSGMLSVILSASGLGTSLTGFGAIIGVPLGVVGGICGGVSVGFGAASKRLYHKVSKHEQTVSLAKAKVNTIHDLVSKALKDNAISDQEFSLILSEVDKFEKLKLEIRQKTRKDTEKNLNMNQIRTEVRAEILKELIEVRGRTDREH